jgi:peptidoglycan/LPS O-acetylase OafA/YrhL
MSKCPAHRCRVCAQVPTDSVTNRSERFYLPQLDGLRFLAFLLVFLHHFRVAPLPGILGAMARIVHDFGWIGVELFFALSAFLMTSLLLREHDTRGSIAVGAFFIRRILRIWPLYYWAVFIGFVVVPLLEGLPFSSAAYRELVSSFLWPYLLLLGNVAVAMFGYPRATTTDALSILWTISAEEQFYLVLPFALMALARGSLRRWLGVLAAISLLGLAVRAGMLLWTMTIHPTMWVLPVAKPDSFLVGILIAVAMRRAALAERVEAARAGVLLAGSLALLCLVVLFPTINYRSWHQMWQYPAMSVGIGGVLLFLVNRGQSPIALPFRVRAIVYLGKISYGLYIYHLLSLTAVRRAFVAIGQEDHSSLLVWSAQGALSLGVTVAVAAASYRWLETPFLRLKEKFERVRSRPI